MIEASVFLLTVTAVWFICARNGERYNWFVRHFLSGLIALLAATATTAVAATSAGGAVFGYVVDGLLLYGAWMVWSGRVIPAAAPNDSRPAMQLPDRQAPMHSDTPAASASVPRRAPPKKRRHERSEHLDVVMFRYRDREGSETERTVNVTGMDEEKFEGWCHARRAPRTFRLDRVRGRVTSIETGEVRSAHAWMRALYNDPRNRGVSDY